MTEHSALPWKWHPSYPKDQRIGSIFRMERPGHAYAIAMQPRYVEDEQFAADAALIVHAVNNHEPMLEMLREAAAQLEYMQMKMPTGTSAAVLARIHHTLTDLISPPRHA